MADEGYSNVPRHGALAPHRASRRSASQRTQSALDIALYRPARQLPRSVRGQCAVPPALRRALPSARPPRARHSPPCRPAQTPPVDLRGAGLEARSGPWRAAPYPEQGGKPPDPHRPERDPSPFPPPAPGSLPALAFGATVTACGPSPDGEPTSAGCGNPSDTDHDEDGPEGELRDAGPLPLPLRTTHRRRSRPPATRWRHRAEAIPASRAWLAAGPSGPLRSAQSRQAPGRPESPRSGGPPVPPRPLRSRPRRLAYHFSTAAHSADRFTPRPPAAMAPLPGTPVPTCAGPSGSIPGAFRTAWELWLTISALPPPLPEP